MKSKILLILAFLMLFSVGVGFLIYLTVVEENVQESARDERAEQEPEEKKPEQFVSMTDAGFSINVPDGWMKNSKAGDWPVIITNVREEISNEKAKEMNFQTNVSVNLADPKGVSANDYIENVKTQLIQNIPTIKIVKEEEGSINGKEAHFIEIGSNQLDIDFKTLLVFVKDENIIWAISFNTLKDSWGTYQNMFRQIA